MGTKETTVLTAKILRQHGYTQRDIAERLGVTDRTVRNYLAHDETFDAPKVRKSKLDPYKQVIGKLVEERNDLSAILILERIQALGYTGKISVLRDYVAAEKEKLYREAIIRFETEPGRQAQVDWKEFGTCAMEDGERKLYAFVMTLGYSRRSFVWFTRSMSQNVLLECHVKAFEHFCGVPKDILYDNMKTAFVCDSGGIFRPNERLLGLANHYGFLPKRCRVRRPQTKGKVERFIEHLTGNFWPRVKEEALSIPWLNEQVASWLAATDEKPLREFGETRAERFVRERGILTPLPVGRYDTRDIHRVLVNSESFIQFETNRYSVPPAYRGENLTLKVDAMNGYGEILLGRVSIRTFSLYRKGENKKTWLGDDREQVMRAWEKDRDRRAARENKKRAVSAVTQVDVRHPSVYDRLLAEVRS